MFNYAEYKTIEIIDENFTVIEWNGLQMIYSANDNMINATKLVSSISSKHFNNWTSSADGKLFQERFPEKFVSRNPGDVFGCKDMNRVSGTYVSWSLIPVIVSWANVMRGYFLVNNFRKDYERDTTGYIYIVQTEEFKGTNKYKIGRTWNPKQRFHQYGKNLNVIRCEKVGNMYRAEESLIYDLGEFVTKPFKGKEWFDCDIDEIEYYFQEACKAYPVSKRN